MKNRKLLILLVMLFLIACSNISVVKGKDVFEEKFYSQCDKIAFYFPDESICEIIDKKEIEEICRELRNLDLKECKAEDIPLGGYIVQLYSGEDIFSFGIGLSQIVIDGTVYEYDNNQLVTRLAGGGEYKTIIIELQNHTSDTYELDSEDSRYFMIEYSFCINHGEKASKDEVDISQKKCSVKITIVRENAKETLYLCEQYMIHEGNIYLLDDESYVFEMIKRVKK